MALHSLKSFECIVGVNSASLIVIIFSVAISQTLISEVIFSSFVTSGLEITEHALSVIAAIAVAATLAKTFFNSTPRWEGSTLFSLKGVLSSSELSLY